MSAAAELQFEPVQVQSTADTGAHRAFADVLAVAQSLGAGCRATRWRTERRQQPTSQLFVSPAFLPEALQPVPGQGFACQAQRSDAAFFNFDALAD